MFSVPARNGDLLIEEVGNKLRKLTAVPSSPSVFISRQSCTTTYSLDLIQQFLDVVGLAAVCEVIGRDTDPKTVADNISRLSAAYCDAVEFVNKRILDFGCGYGASSIALAKLFPESEVVGVDLREDRIRLASACAEHHGLANAKFSVAPSGSELPSNIGQFDFVYLFAVYEHLLPAERPVIMKLLWSVLKPGGTLFIDATPHRYFPVDLHSTNLPLINYLPDRLAHYAARKFARVGPQINKSPLWEDHLRGGLRGATEKQILRNIGQDDAFVPVLLTPSKHGLNDRCDYWYSQLSPRYSVLKKAIRRGLKSVYRVSGTVLTPNISLAIKKQRGPSDSR